MAWLSAVCVAEHTVCSEWQFRSKSAIRAVCVASTRALHYSYSLRADSLSLSVPADLAEEEGAFSNLHKMCVCFFLKSRCVCK